jgi:ketosteroid isomerase-like protein
MAVAPEAEALLRRTYDAFNRKDIDTALSVAQPDVDWPNMLDGTRVVGVDDLRAYFERQFRVIDPQVEPLSFTDDDGTVVVRVRHVVRFLSDGEVVVDQVLHHLYTFRDGRVAAMDVRDADGNLIPPRRPSASGLRPGSGARRVSP